MPVYEVGEHDGQKYFSMKLVEGGNLAEQLARYTENPRAAATVVAEAAEAVHHAHMRGILHRDLKPANILIDLDGHPHVTDFGLAKRVEADPELTASGMILGTPAYMSPEQATGQKGTITTATDVYGLGAILYALLAGKAPFGGESAIQTIEAVRNRAARAAVAVQREGSPRPGDDLPQVPGERSPKKVRRRPCAGGRPASVASTRGRSPPVAWGCSSERGSGANAGRPWPLFRQRHSWPPSAEPRR